MNTIIAESIQNFSIDDYRPIVVRDLDLGEPLVPRRGNLVKVVMGMRRSGKSYRLLQEMDALLDSGVSSARICYFNFEDDRLAPVTSSTGDEVLEAFYASNPSALDEGAYLFFDELQEMDGWGRWLRRVVDTTKATVYVSGSSSKMLSSEISTEFRGRALGFELLPFSFSEYVRATDIDARAGKLVHSTKERLILENAFAEYLESGGFPATVGLLRQHAIMLLQSYVERVVVRDVVERHGLSRYHVANALVRRAMACNAMPFSLRKAEADMRSLGIKTSRATLACILGYFENAYLLFTVNQFSYALSQRTTAVPKVYAVDAGLALANAKANTNNLGQRLEDAVYLELRCRCSWLRRESICSYQTRGHGYEVDFVVGDVLEREPYEFVQVSADVSDEATLERELRALWEAMGESGVSESALVVLEGAERSYERQGMTVRQVPAWRWFTEASRERIGYE